ncbi:MAG: sodium:calcium antiporter [Phycisphaeraceae bacterium]
MVELNWPLWLNIVVFVAAGAVIAVVGTKLARIADRLADRTGMGEAITGAVLLGATTSLPGITTSVTVALAGRADLAISNAIGGIAAQTAFLGVADFFNRGANLEHAAASVPSIIYGTLLVAMLAGVSLAGDSPDVTWLSIHPVTPLLVLAYLGGIHLVRRSGQQPQWLARQTRQTRQDVPDEPPEGETLRGLWIWFVAAAVTTALSGWFVAKTGTGIAEQTGISATVVGGLLMAVSTSTPELVTAIAAVRQGALTLAVTNIIGGNAFDVLFAAAADVAYREGSIYHAVGPQQRFLVALSIIMTSVLVMGLVHREKRGIANIGFESVLMLLFYVGGFLVLTLVGTP